MTSGNFFRTFNILFFALLVGQIIFALIAIFFAGGQSFVPKINGMAATLVLVAPLFGAGGLFAGNFFKKARLKTIRQHRDISVQLQNYQTTMILKYALLEGTSLFSIVCFLLTGNYFFLGIAAVIMLFFFTNKPSPEKTAIDLELTIPQKNLLLNPNTKLHEISLK